MFGLLETPGAFLGLSPTSPSSHEKHEADVRGKPLSRARGVPELCSLVLLSPVSADGSANVHPPVRGAFRDGAPGPCVWHERDSTAFAFTNTAKQTFGPPCRCRYLSK